MCKDLSRLIAYQNTIHIQKMPTPFYVLGSSVNNELMLIIFGTQNPQKNSLK